MLTGYSPWVTGADRADLIVLGATLESGQQILAAVPTDLPGVVAGEPSQLVGLSASRTGPIHCHDVLVAHDLILAGPAENVMKSGVGGGTGGLQTSTLAVGLATAAIDYLRSEAKQRPELLEPTEELARERQALEDDLLSLAAGVTVCSNEQIRVRANSLVLRATQAALASAKGAGYVVGHPAGRWCREALFFLVWSCPQPVLAANLCELAGLSLN